MWIVTLKHPLPGVAATTFLFHNYEEACEFQSCLHATRDQGQPAANGVICQHVLETTLSVIGLATDVFPHWSV